MAIVTGDRYLDYLVKFVDKQAGLLLEGALVLKLNPVGLHYVQSRLEALQELEGLLAGAPVDYLRAYISDLGDHRALEQLRRILRLLTSLKVVSVLPSAVRDPTPLSLLPFGRLKVLELRGCDLSTSAAKGLLELRHTLEKIICHNSTDALRHVFASRIADIKHSPVWNRLTFVSCAWNELVLMDESLQLLPAVETLDLSRNRFAKVDNLRNCTKLRHLDLGFNQLRTISSFREVACSIVKLVLRNNALTSLRGIENLKSVEGLDLSYNIISNFSELEILASLTSLQDLWLEGNPICCARWYRAQVFSSFTHLQELKLDDKGISSRETWQSQIILASRQRRPAGFGFYSPAKVEAKGEDSINSKRKKLSRLACIEDEEFRRNLLSESVEQDSVSWDSENRSREENILSDSEAEIVELMNKVEFMKKERSVLWLREFKEWMDHTSEDMAETHKFTGLMSPRQESDMNKKKYYNNLGESSRYVSDSAQASGNETGTNILKSDNSHSDTCIGVSSSPYFNLSSEGVLDSTMERNREAREESNHLLLSRDDSIFLETSTVQGGERIFPTANSMQLTAIDEIMESHSSIHAGSPPHYQEDILHRRQNLEEEFMQLSAESYSLASSDSNTSCSDGDLSILNSLPELGHLLLNEESLNRIMDGHPKLLIDGSGFEARHEAFHLGNGKSYLNHASSAEHIEPDHAQQFCVDEVNDSCGGEDQEMIDETGCLDKRKARRRLKRRVVSLAEGNEIADSDGPLSQKQNGILDASQTNMDDDPGRQAVGCSEIPHEVINTNQTKHALTTPFDRISNSCMMKSISHLLTDESIKSYFHANSGYSEVSETCLQYMLCDCIFEDESGNRESEVALLLSSEHKLYVLIVDLTSEGAGAISKVIGSHRLEDIKEVVTGIGLQILRVHIGVDITYMFITRDIDKSRELLCLLQVSDPTSTSNQCSLKSLEQVQVESFEKYISGGLKVSIFLYSMLLFWHNNNEEESWLARSLFVIEGYMLVCIDDLIQFSSATVNDVSSSPYYSLDSCCSISNISEMVIEPKESRCVTLTLDCVAPEKFYSSSSDIEQEKPVKEFKDKMVTGSQTWKFKWFSEETLLKFVALLKALHAGITISPLPVKYIS